MKLRPPHPRADGVGGGAPAPLRNAGYAGRAVGAPGSPPRGREGHRSSPETLGRTPPHAVRDAKPGPVRRARCARCAHRPRSPAGTAGSRCRSRSRRHCFGSSAAGEQNKQPCRRRQRTDVTTHAARAAPRHRRRRRRRRPACASCWSSQVQRASLEPRAGGGCSGEERLARPEGWGGEPSEHNGRSLRTEG